nr:MAG TPA: hypothetical protein [Bacteriophage sp.]
MWYACFFLVSLSGYSLLREGQSKTIGLAR